MGVLGHAELTESQQRAALVEQAEHALLTPDGGDGRDPNVDAASFDRQRELTILWTAPFDDVHARHDLESAEQRGADVDRQRERVVQRTVDPVPDTDLVSLRFDVDVGCPIPQGLRHDEVDDLDHGGFRGGVGRVDLSGDRPNR